VLLSKKYRKIALKRNKPQSEIVENALDSLNCHDYKSCRWAIMQITKSLLRRGIKNFKVVEGKLFRKGVMRGQNEKPWLNTWIVFDDGTIVDPTKELDQRGVYVKSKRTYVPSVYLESARKEHKVWEEET